MNPRERITAIFDREIDQADEDCEPTFRIEWIERIRDEALAALD